MDELKVLYDHQAFELQRFGGISRYICELIKEMPADKCLSLRCSTNYYLRNEPGLGVERGLYLPERPYKWLKGMVKLVNRKHSIRLLREGGFSVFHPTYYHPYFLSELQGTPYVVTVHDMNHEIFSHVMGRAEQMKEWKRAVILNATRVIAISENTKRDLMKWLSVSPEKIDVVYHGIKQEKVVYSGLRLPARYILYVGARGAYKNFSLFVQAFAALARTDRTLYLVCTGSKLTKGELQQLEDLRIADRVLAMKVGELELAQLYQQAQMFVYPSLYEGFGIPILEAFVNECPVALSDTSCFPEVAGEAGEYFNPAEVEAMEEAMHRLLSDEELRRYKVAAGKARVTRFTWQRTAYETLETYKKCM